MCDSPAQNELKETKNCRVLRVRFQRTRRMTERTDPPRRAMAHLHNDMVRLHKRIRRAHGRWPTGAEFDAHFLKRKHRYVGLSTGCIQQAVRKFFGNLATTRTNRKKGLKARYPWRDQKRFATVPYRGDLVKWKEGYLTLGGGNGTLPIILRMAEDPGKILKAELRFDEVLITVALPEPSAQATTVEPTDAPAVIGAGDPGQRWAWTILAENGQSLMVNGRGLVSEKIRRAKKQGHLQAALAGKQRGSKRYRKIKRRMARLKAKSARRVRDINHKITCSVVRFSEEAGITQLVLSQPDGIAEAPGRKAQRQRNGVWEYGEQSRQIEYKAQGKSEIIRDGERGTSSTCPRCGHRHKTSGRVFRCPACGWTGHRDLLGAGNQLGRHASHVDVAALIDHTHPKYLRSFATAKDRSSVVETDRSRGRQPLPPDAADPNARREWLAGDYAGRAAPEPRSRKASCATVRSARKNLGAHLVLPRTPRL